MSWATQSSEKSRLRNTANIDGAGTDAAVMRPPSAALHGADHRLDPSGRPASPRVSGASLARAPRYRDAFAQQQGLLARPLPLPIDPAVAAVAAERAVAGDDAMARDEQRDRVALQRAADGAGRAGRTHSSRDAAIARRLTPADGPHGFQGAPIEDGTIIEIDGYRAGVGSLPGEQVDEDRQGCLEPAARWMGRRDLVRGEDRQPDAHSDV